MALKGVSNYCHSAYDWSAAEDNPSIMYVEMGEDTKNIGICLLELNKCVFLQGF